MQKHKHPLKLKIFTYIVLFTIFIFILIWLFQIIFLRNYYEKSKTNELMESVLEIKELYKRNESIYEYIDINAYDKGICTEVVSKEIVTYTTNPLNRGCLNLHNKDINIKKMELDFINSSKEDFVLRLDNKNNHTKILIYGIKLDENTTIFSNTSIEPIDSTVNILKSQLIVITIATIIIAIIMAYFIANMLCKPITSLTEKSKILSEGNFKVDFNVNSDIIEIDDLSQSLNTMKNVLKQNDDIRRDLMANVSHDLKTPLTMIKAYAEMIRDLNFNNPEKRQNDLNIIIDEVDRLNILVNDILVLSKLESNIDKMNREELDLVELISKIISRFKIFSVTQDYKFVFLAPKKLVIKADKQKIEQVIYNLISNAVNYSMDTKKIYITILPRKNIRVNISDTGPGIKDEDIKNIWNKYYRAEKNYQRNTVGTGLGLSIVKNILELNSYKYGVISKKNKGTTFFFELKNAKKGKN